MNHKTKFHKLFPMILVLLTAVVVVAGCAASSRSQGIPSPSEESELGAPVSVEAFKEAGRADDLSASPSSLSTAGEETEPGGPGVPPLASPYGANRMIIKNAELSLLMEDVGSGIDRVTQVADDTFGYILSSRTWYQGSFQYATITIGVPVDEFENALRRLRGMAIKVQNETASGTDVSDQYVDLESRLRNLEATEARIRSFLEQAMTVEESLRINQQLTEISAQIEEVKGRMNYLKDRAAYSTITVHLQPEVPTPTPVPNVWRPGKTFRRAAGVLSDIMRVVGDAAIWAAVVLGPFALPVALVLWAVIRSGKQRRETAQMRTNVRAASDADV
jgi:uncharacterized coiled-coil protein SlyX